MYNISAIAFRKELDRPGSSVRSLPRGTYTIRGVKHGYADMPLEAACPYANVKRQRLTTTTKGGGEPPPVALAAPPAVSTAVVLTPRGFAAESLPSSS